MEWKNAFGRRWSGSLSKLECQFHFFLNIRLFQERLWNPYSRRLFFISFWWLRENIFNDRFWNPYLSCSFLLRYLLWLYAPMSIRGDMVILFFRWILVLPFFLLIQIWGIIFHAWWSTLVLWSLYILSYIKNLIFSSIWSNSSIYCFSSISFRFQSREGNTYQTLILDSTLSILSISLPILSISSAWGNIVFFKIKFVINFVSFVRMCSWVVHVWVVLWSWVDLTTSLFDYMCSRKWSHISQRGANVCTLKWSPRLWAPLFNLSISWINLSKFLNQWFAIFY